MRTMFSAALAVLLVLPAFCLAEETNPNPQPPEGPPKVRAEKQPEDGDVDVVVTPGNAEIRVWKTREKGWVKVKKVELEPLNTRTAGVPYKHELFGQYFPWGEDEKPPAQEVIFVIIQQTHPIVIADINTKEIKAVGTCTHFMHFLVDPKTAKVIKEFEGANQAFLPPPVPKPKKEQPKPAPKKKPQRVGPTQVA